MAAPIVAVIVAALTGAALPVGAGASVFGARAGTVLAIDASAKTLYADLPAICAATDKALDDVSDLADAKNAKGALLRRAADSLARSADAVCAADKGPNTAADRLVAAVSAIDAIAKANAATAAAAAPTSASQK